MQHLMKYYSPFFSRVRSQFRLGEEDERESSNFARTGRVESTKINLPEPALASRLGLEVLLLLSVAWSGCCCPVQVEEIPAKVDDCSVNPHISTLVVMCFIYRKGDCLRVAVGVSRVTGGIFG